MTSVEDPPADRPSDPWSGVPEWLRTRGLRWTPQRRLLIEVLSGIDGHVTGADLIERCRKLDSETIPSTVYRTLDVLEEIGLVRHGHGADGREEYHVLPAVEHGHLYCAGCGAVEEISEDELASVGELFGSRHGFTVDGSHITIVGRCRACRGAPET
jgi:Fur family transcriptional regulator, ferric uptake regulator